MEIRYEHLNPKNFDAYSLDTFQRRQAVKECWRYVDGMWQLRPVSFEENWDLPQLREIAGDIAAHMTVDQSAFGAFAGDQAVGFITVSHRLFGRSARYAELVYFMVSEPFRGRGIGRRLSLSEGSSFTGSISGEITNSRGETVSTQVGEVSVTLDGDSTWTLTGDSCVTSFTGDAAQVISGGFTLYVDGVALEGTC